MSYSPKEYEHYHRKRKEYNTMCVFPEIPEKHSKLDYLVYSIDGKKRRILDSEIIFVKFNQENNAVKVTTKTDIFDGIYVPRYKPEII